METRDIVATVENRLDMKMEDEMENGVIRWFIESIVVQGNYRIWGSRGTGSMGLHKGFKPWCFCEGSQGL